METMLKATHSGVLPCGNIPCYVLEDGRRVLSGRGMQKAMGIERTGQELALFCGLNSIDPFITNDLRAVIRNPIVFKCATGIAHGYEAEVLIDLCKAVLAARVAGSLKPNQLHIAAQCELLCTSFSKVGIISFVDESTGYQSVRGDAAIAGLVAKYLLAVPSQWHQIYPNEFALHIARLHDWQGWKEEDIKRIHHIRKLGTMILEVIYTRLPPEVLREIDLRNPSVQQGRWQRRGKTIHQYLTDAIGREHVSTLISQAIAVMAGYDVGEWSLFMRHWDKVHPRTGQQLVIDNDYKLLVAVGQMGFVFE